MADDNFFTFQIDEKSVDIFGQSILDASESNIKKALGKIKQEWQKEFVRQHNRLQSTWTPLKRTPKGRSYYERKRHDYYKGKGRGGQVKYLKVLTRTGTMLKGYIQGIYVNNVDLAVTIPWPDGAETRAMVHQGELPLPKGVQAARPFQIERFEDIAIQIMDEAI